MNNKIEYKLKKELKFIYTQLDTLKAYNPYANAKSDLKRIAGTTSRVYLLESLAESLANENIITRDFYNKICISGAEILNELTRLENNIAI